MNTKLKRPWKDNVQMAWHLIAVIGLAALLTGIRNANPTTVGSSELVVGIDQWPLFHDDMLRKEKVNLPAGTQVSVVREPSDRIDIEVRTASGTSGFIHRFALCTPVEFQRRKSQGKIPHSVAKFIHKDGHFYLTPVTGYMDISIGNDTPQTRAGQAYWMDDSTQGKPFNLDSKQVYANHLYLVKADGSVAELPIWYGSAPGTVSIDNDEHQTDRKFDFVHRTDCSC